MKLQLKEMGCRIKEGCGNGTDLINYRLRAEFTDKSGIKVCCDFGGWQRRDAIPYQNVPAWDGWYREVP